jgi:hypothetical protein
MTLTSKIDNNKIGVVPSISGIEFNNLIESPLYMFTNYNEIHNGYTYVDGLNVDNNYEASIRNNGNPMPNLVFYDLQCACDKILCNRWFREVIVPDDATVTCNNGLYFADKLILGDRLSIDDFKIPTENIKYIGGYSTNVLKYIDNTEEVLRNLIKVCPIMIYQLNKPSDELILYTIRNSHGSASLLEYLETQTDKICIDIIKQDTEALQYVHNQTNELCIESIKHDTSALQYVHNQTNELCELAIDIDPMSLKYVRDQTFELCIRAAKLNIQSLTCIRDMEMFRQCSNTFTNEQLSDMETLRPDVVYTFPSYPVPVLYGGLGYHRYSN